MNLAPKLLWIDCSAGATVGALVSLLHGWLADLYGLPSGFVLFMGLANMAYGTFSFTLAFRNPRPRLQFMVLVVANLCWALLCLLWTVHYCESASIFGMAHLLLEAAFVGGLGVAEWRNRADLNITAAS